MQPRVRTGLILILFFGSGATALVYEVVWSKFLSQMLGSTIYAQTVVLAVFMGGLALGNRLFGRRADRLQRPVRAYGYLEIGIGIYAVLFTALYRVADRLFVSVGVSLVSHTGWLFLLKCVLSAALLIGPTVLMGGTLPLLAAWLQQSTADAGRRSARFYSVNSLGAVLGAGLAGFWLVRQFGMGSTLWLTALANIIIGSAAIMLGRRSERSQSAASESSAVPTSHEPALTRLRGRSHFGAAKARPSAFAKATADKPGTLSHPMGEGRGEGRRGRFMGRELVREEQDTIHEPGGAELPLGQDAQQRVPTTSSGVDLIWAGPIVALTGGVSMGLEVLSSRSLALIFGSSLQTFAVVLMAFILGIGLGSAWIASPRRRVTGERTVVGLLCAAAAWITLLVFNIERWVDCYRLVLLHLGRTDTGYVHYQLLATGMALVILGFPAALIGAVLPLMIRAVSSEFELLGARVGSLLTWNTLGAVGGTLLTGFVLMPRVGLRNAFGVLALTLVVAALVLALRRRWVAGLSGAAGVGLCVCCLFVFGDEGWRHVMGTGIFRLRESRFQPELMAQLKRHVKILFYEDAPDATVSVEEVDGIIAPKNRGLRINGKPDAGTSRDVRTQFMLAHLPMLAQPGARDVFVLGLGSGITAGALLAYPVERIVIAENCEPVVRAARWFGEWNHEVLDDRRTRVWMEDARTVLKLQPQLYDVIITEPSNPWTVGIGSVFSREYYQLAASRLKPGGLIAQWFHVYEVDDQILSLVLRTFSSVFPYVEIWDTGNFDIVMLGSLQPWASGPESFRPGFTLDPVRRDMERMDIRSPEALMARQLASQRTGFAIAGDGPVQSDLFPILEYDAPRAFFIGGLCRLLDRFDERTRRQWLAPAGKLAALRSLPLEEAQVLFRDQSSLNGELLVCLFNTAADAGVPCVFPTPRPVPAPGSDGSLLSRAEQAFAAGNLSEAERLVALELQQNPTNTLAGYVRRVIEREKRISEKPADHAEHAEGTAEKP